MYIKLLTNLEKVEMINFHDTIATIFIKQGRVPFQVG